MTDSDPDPEFIPDVRGSFTRLRRRHAALPSINILPSFKSLKSYGIDMDDNNNKKEKNDKNKRLNLKEIKQIYIKNLKLQGQIDKYKEREKEFDYKLSEQSELIHDLKNQIELKEQLSASVDLKKRVQELERLLVEKDTTIQTLQQSMVNMEKQKMLFARSVDTLSPTDSYDRIGDTVHKRSLTPGGYQLKSQSLQAALRNLHRRKASQKLDKLLINRPNIKHLQDTNILKNIDEDNNIDGLALNEKIKQRPSWKDVNARGILG